MEIKTEEQVYTFSELITEMIIFVIKVAFFFAIAYGFVGAITGLFINTLPQYCALLKPIEATTTSPFILK